MMCPVFPSLPLNIRPRMTEKHGLAVSNNAMARTIPQKASNECLTLANW